jgi:NADPH:quinone reductase-like Zn-dependent oxidoreductase
MTSSCASGQLPSTSDVFILNGTYPLPAKPGVVPISDGAGEIVAVGGLVTRFKVGDRAAGP